MTVYVRGQWNWLSHDKDCNFTRAGTGLSMIWNDTTETGYTLTKGAISAQVGVKAKDGSGPTPNAIDGMAIRSIAATSRKACPGSRNRRSAPTDLQ